MSDIKNGCYGREPFDAKLAILRLARSLRWIIGITLFGMLLFGGGYYVKNVLLQGEKQFCATSIYRVEYADPQWAANGSYINYMTWTTWVNTKEIKDRIRDRMGSGYGAKEVTVTAEVASDFRVPSTKVISASAEYSLAYAKALEEVMVGDFSLINPKDVSEIRLIDPALAVMEVHPDVRPVRALILSGILTLFFALLFFFLKEWGEDSIWLPATLYRRYGLRVLDTVQKQGFDADLEYYFRGMERVALCPVDDEVSAEEVCEFLKKREEHGKEENGAGVRRREKEWIALPAILTDRTVCESCKEADGILLLVRAGHHPGKRLEYALELLAQHECSVTCAMLWGMDEKLVKSYYRFGGRKDAGGSTGGRSRANAGTVGGENES